MISDNEISNIIKSSTETSSDSFIDIIRKFAEDLRLEDLANALNIYFDKTQGKKEYIKNRLSGILESRCFIKYPNFVISNFNEWIDTDDNNANWIERVFNKYKNPELFRNEIEKIISESQI